MILVDVRTPLREPQSLSMRLGQHYDASACHAVELVQLYPSTSELITIKILNVIQ